MSDEKQITLSDSKYGTKEEIIIKEAIERAEEIAKKEVETVKKDIFVIFGIFASFIAFIVGEINILKTIDSIYDKVGFSFLFVSLMLGFLFGVIFLLDNNSFQEKYRKMGIVFSLFFFMGLCFLTMPLITKYFYYAAI